MKRVLLGMLAMFTLVALGSQSALAQDKPLMVVSVSSIDAVLTDADYIKMKAAPQIPILLKAAAAPILQGVDMKRPLGVAVSLEGPAAGTGLPEPTAVSFIPVNDLDAVFDTINQFGGRTEDLGGGITQVTPPGGGGRSSFVKESNGYAFVALEQSFLKNLPDPAKVLGRLPFNYDMAVAVNVSSLPEEVKQFAIGMISEGIDQSLENVPREPEETDAEYEIRKKVAQQTARSFLEALERAIDEMEQLALGMTIEGNEKKVLLDIVEIAKPGTKTAEQIAQLAAVRSRFAALADPRAPFSMNVASVVTDEGTIQLQLQQLQQAKQTLVTAIEQEIDSQEERDIAKKFLDRGWNLLTAQVKEGRSDGSFVLRQTASQQFQLIGGFYLADAKEAERLVKDTIKFAQQTEEDVPEFKLDFAQHGGVNLHELVLPPPPNAEAARQMTKVVGRNPKAFIGFGQDSVWVALGSEALSALKGAIDATRSAPQQVQPLSMHLSLLPFMKLAEDQPAVGRIMQRIKAGNDGIRIGNKVVNPTTVRTRFEVDEGVIEMIGIAIQEATTGGALGGGDDDFDF